MSCVDRVNSGQRKEVVQRLNPDLLVSTFVLSLEKNVILSCVL